MTEGTLEDRLDTVGRDRYGAIHRGADGQMIERPGFDRWVTQAIHVSREPSDAAIAITARTIDVVLPSGMTRRQLDLGLRKGLAAFALDTVAGVECFTAYSGIDRLSRATELVIGPDPRHGDVLLGIVEAILADHRANEMGRPRQAPFLSDGSRINPSRVTAPRRRMSDAMQTRMRMQGLR